MTPGAHPTSRTKAERTIALARVALACTSLFAIWLDPAEPARLAPVTYTLHAIYVTYSIGLALVVTLRPIPARLPVVTHAIDLGMFSLFQFLTRGPSSPFFVYLIFSLFCAAVRWGWRATLWTAGVVVTAYMLTIVWVSRHGRPPDFELNRAIIRTMYLIVSAALLVYLGRYQERLRGEIERLARWPAVSDLSLERAAERFLGHAADIVGSRRVLAVWEAAEEPSSQLALWMGGRVVVRSQPPAEADSSALAEAGGKTTVVLPGPIRMGSVSGAAAGEGAGPARLPALPPAVLDQLEGAVGLASAAFQTERVRGRVYFADLGTPGAEIVPLTELVAREIGTSLDQLHLARHLADVAASEARIRLAGDLHDGMLQSLTGIRLELRAVATGLDGQSEPPRERLLAVERALAREQRELRLFIESLGPAGRGATSARREEALAARLEAVRERLALAWKTPVSIRVAPGTPELPPRFVEPLPLMVHEAIVNALKHAEPSRVVVTVEADGGDLRVVVADDGRGFPFRGRHDHDALASLSAAPRSLYARVASLGGRLSIDSTEAGSQVEIRLPLST